MITSLIGLILSISVANASKIELYATIDTVYSCTSSVCTPINNEYAPVLEIEHVEEKQIIQSGNTISLTVAP